jgi:transposase
MTAAGPRTSMTSSFSSHGPDLNGTEREGKRSSAPCGGLHFPGRATTRHYLQRAYAGFFEGRTGYPRFKRKRILTGSAEYTKSGFTWRGGELKLAKHTMPLAERTFTCPDPGCGHIENRDVNAAKNILAAGLAVAACGDGVRPKRR